MSSHLTVPTLCKTIRTLITKGDRSTEKGEQFYIAAGKHLEELKERRPDDISWASYVQEHCGIGRSRADELIQIADGRTTLKKVRDDNAASHRISRQETNPPGRPGGKQSLVTFHDAPQDEVEEEPWVDTPDEADDPEDTALRKKASFLIVASEALRSARYSGPVDDDVLGAARSTRAAWEDLIATMEK